MYHYRAGNLCLESKDIWLYFLILTLTERTIFQWKTGVKAKYVPSTCDREPPQNVMSTVQPSSWGSTLQHLYDQCHLTAIISSSPLVCEGSMLLR